MLSLINTERINAGLTQVVLGNNRAAQIHADNSLANCISSHWGIDGLTPDMRYSLAGGDQAANEVVSGSDYCRLPGQGYSPITSLAKEVRAHMASWMNSPGHRTEILKPRQRKVNIGLAWDRYNFASVLQFEGDYVTYTTVPALDGGVLRMEGSLKNGASLEHGYSIVTVHFFPPPRELTQGQIARVYGSCLGLKVALQSYRSSGTTEITWDPCLSPYDVPADAPAPTSRLNAHELWAEARERHEALGEKVPITVARVKMSTFVLEGDQFRTAADLGSVLTEQGPGVYVVNLFAVLDEEVQVISEHAIFHEIPRPSGYDAM